MDDPIYLHLPSGSPPPALEGEAAFRAVIIIEQAVDEAWRAVVSNWLVRSGCLYMIAWGDNCGAWDDSVDLANLSAFDFGTIPDDRFVMTTWHSDETLAEAFWFAGFCGFHPTVDLDRTLIVHIAADARGADLIKTYRAAQLS